MSTLFVKDSRKVHEVGRSVLRRMALERQRFLQELGARIGKRRAELRLTQDKAAERSCVTLRAYQRWERGESMPYPRNLEQLAEALETTPEELLAEVTPTTPDDLPGQVAHAVIAGVVPLIAAIEVQLRELTEKLDKLTPQNPGHGNADPERSWR